MAMNTNAIQQISIHASAKEATGLSVDEQISGIDFNPRLREGGDTEDKKILDVIEISIHASAKEATI